MAWDSLWEKIFVERGDWGRYPPEVLIRFVARNYYRVPDRSSISFLDVGCGFGAASWYLCKEGFNVHAVDGSPTCIHNLKERLAKENLSADLKVADIIALPYPDESFNCVVELNCLMCNDLSSSQKIIAEMFRVTKKGGHVFSLTPQTGSWGDGIGVLVGPATYTDATSGPYANMGKVRFSAREEIPALYSPYRDLSIDSVSYTLNNGSHTIQHWCISGKKE